MTRDLKHEERYHQDMSESDVTDLEHAGHRDILATVTKETLEFNKPCSKHDIRIDFCVVL